MDESTSHEELHFQSSILLALASATKLGRVSVSRIAFCGDMVEITLPNQVLKVGASASGEQTLREAGVYYTPDVEFALEGEDLWSELLYDLASNIDLLERVEPGLRYRVIEHVEKSARASLTRDGHRFDFFISLDEPAIGLPDTLHTWAHRYPEGFADPVRL